MDTCGSGGVYTANQVAVDVFGHEGDHGSSQLAYGYQSGVQGHVSVDLILLHALGPVTSAAAAYIPITQIVHEGLQGAGGFGQTIVFQVGVYFADQGVQLGQQPLIHYRQFIVFQGVLGGIEAVDIRIEDKERIGVPKGTHELALSLRNGFKGHP